MLIFYIFNDKYNIKKEKQCAFFFRKKWLKYLHFQTPSAFIVFPFVYVLVEA